jgi:hypothetical protein
VSRRVSVVLLSLAALALLSACGVSGDTTTIINKTTTTQTGATSASTAATTTAQGGPQGDLTADGVGDVVQGMSTSEVRGLFGPPDKQRRSPGCELNAHAAPVLAWTWNAIGGTLSLDFDARQDSLMSYRTDSAEFQTADGISVGDSFASLRDAVGSSLAPLNLGASSTPKRGFWLVREGPGREILFSIDGGRVDMIQGGSVSICE